MILESTFEGTIVRWSNSYYLEEYHDMSHMIVITGQLPYQSELSLSNTYPNQLPNYRLQGIVRMSSILKINLEMRRKRTSLVIKKVRPERRSNIRRQEDARTSNENRGDIALENVMRLVSITKMSNTRGKKIANSTTDPGKQSIDFWLRTLNPISKKSADTRYTTPPKPMSCTQLKSYAMILALIQSWEASKSC